MPDAKVIPVLTVLGVALTMAIFEVIFSYRVVAPDIQKGSHAMLQSMQSKMNDQWQSYLGPLRIIMGVLHDRELRLIRTHNKSGRYFSACIILLLVLLTLWVCIAARAQLHGEWTAILRNVAFVCVCLILFQILFYQMGKQWRYGTSSMTLYTLTQNYMHQN